MLSASFGSKNTLKMIALPTGCHEQSTTKLKVTHFLGVWTTKLHGPRCDSYPWCLDFEVTWTQV